MKPPAFDYLRCENLEQALEALHQHGEEARILAGGQSLIAMLNMRLLEPAVLVDINRIPELAVHEWSGSDEKQSLIIGAAVTQTQTLAINNLKKCIPLLDMALGHTGHVQTRNRGTVCGSLAHADPSAELPLAASVLDAQIHLASRRGKRSVAARDFFAGLLETGRSADEMAVAVEFPCTIPRVGGFAFRETAMRHGDFAIVSIAVHVSHNHMIVGVGGGPLRPEIREWPALEGSAIDDALNSLAWEMEFQDDVHATARYRRHLVRETGRAAIAEARQWLK